MSIELVMPSSHLILGCPLLLLPSIPPSIRVFSSESTLRMRWPRYWSLNFSIIPSKEIPGLIWFRMDCLDLLAVQGTLKSLLQHHSSKAAILRLSAFFIIHWYCLILRSHSVFTSPSNAPYSKLLFIIKESSLESHLAFYLSHLCSLFQSKAALQSLTLRILMLAGSWHFEDYLGWSFRRMQVMNIWREYHRCHTVSLFIL